MKRSPWFPMWAPFQDDEAFLMVSAHAELLAVRAIGRCKVRGDDGGQIKRHELRRLCDKFDERPEDLAAELVAAALWDEIDGGRGWQIRAYGEWNQSADDSRQAKVDAGRLGNHNRWKHPDPFETCPKCHHDPDVIAARSGASRMGSGASRKRSGASQEDGPGAPEQDKVGVDLSPADADVSPGQSHDVAVRSQCESQSDRKSSLDKTRQDKTRLSPPTPSPATNRPAEIDERAREGERGEADLDDDAASTLRAVQLADRAISKIEADAVANEDERDVATRWLAAGLPDAKFIELAAKANSRTDLDRPRAWLVSVARTRIERRLADPSPSPNRAPPVESLDNDWPVLPPPRAGDPDAVAAAREAARASAEAGRRRLRGTLP